MTTELTANILVIDDDLKTLRAMEALLSGPGRTIVKAESGKEALRCLLRQDFALILLDVRMPEMDGFETAELIRQNERFRYTPIIFLSAVDTLDEDVFRGVSSGAVDYLFKPVVPEILRAKVSVFVDLFHMNERLKLQAIRQTEERFRMLVESLQDYAIFMLDPEGRVTTWNRGAQGIKGFQHEEIIGQPVARFYTAEDQATGHPHESLQRAAAEGHYEDEGWRVRRDGSRFWADAVITALRDEQGNLVGFSKVTRDLTKRKQIEEELQRLNEELEERVAERTAELVQSIEQRERLQEQLLQAQKMESLGTLAGGIAHDFNNILNIILGYSSVLTDNPSDPVKVRDGLEVIRETVDRGTSLVQQLLTLNRSGNVSFEPTDINDLLRRFAKLLSETFPKTITISLELDPNLPCIMADPNRLHEAMLNLCVNARDAMNGSGSLLLRAETVAVGELRTRFPDAQDESYVCVTVADTGVGMDRTIRERIFDPFFTTKERGQGTGLGLTVAYGIIREHGGYIEVDSEPGRGATFRVYLPLRPVDSRREFVARTVERREEESLEGHGTLLFVDDEAHQIDLIRNFLQKKGYRVLVARDGVEAVEIHRQHKDEIAAVILDLGLPRLGGWEAFLSMKENEPEVRMIFTSGYIKPEIRSEMMNQSVAEIVQKPYLPDELLTKIRAAVSEPTAFDRA